MRGLVLNPPWATLMAAGPKTVETRHWTTPYRGEVLLSASVGWGEGGLARVREIVAGNPEVAEQLWLAGFGDDAQNDAVGTRPLKELHRGVALCVATLGNVLPGRVALLRRPGQEPYGYFTSPNGSPRYGWMFHNIRPFTKPIPWSGGQGLYTLTAEQREHVAAASDLSPSVPR